MSTDSDRYVTPSWWLSLWVTWGVMLTFLACLADGINVSSFTWLIAGCGYAVLFFPLTRPLVTPVSDWYERLAEPTPEHQRRLRELVMRGADSTDAELHMLSTTGANRLASIAPLFAAGTHGIIFGSLAGVTWAFHPHTELTATSCGLIGSAIGVPTAAIIAAIAFAAFLPGQERVSRRMSPWLLLLLSPLFVFPVALHCVRWFRQRERTRTM